MRGKSLPILWNKREVSLFHRQKLRAQHKARTRHFLRSKGKTAKEKKKKTAGEDQGDGENGYSMKIWQESSGRLM